MSDKVYTLEELRKYDGNNNTTPLILLGFNGKVYDVSTSPQFYGPGKSYAVFAGRDCTKGLATNSLSEDMLPGVDGKPVDFESLSENEKVVVRNWEERLSKKYPVVGELKASE